MSRAFTLVKDRLLRRGSDAPTITWETLDFDHIKAGIYLIDVMPTVSEPDPLSKGIWKNIVRVQGIGHFHFNADSEPEVWLALPDHTWVNSKLCRKVIFPYGAKVWISRTKASQHNDRIEAEVQRARVNPNTFRDEIEYEVLTKEDAKTEHRIEGLVWWEDAKDKGASAKYN